MPLILGIWGGKGQGKTFQCNLAYKKLGEERNAGSRLKAALEDRACHVWQQGTASSDAPALTAAPLLTL